MEKVLWDRACQIVLEDALENPEEMKISNAEWNNDTKELYFLITRCTSQMRDIELFLGVKPLNRYQSTVGAALMMEVYKQVINSVAAKVQAATFRDQRAN